MQSKQDNAESFNWYLKTLQAEQQKKKGDFRSVEQEFNPEIVSNLLRFIKVFSPSVERLMDFCKNELDVSLIEATTILDNLEKNEEIVVEEVSKPSADQTAAAIIERIVKITSKGLEKI